VEELCEVASANSAKRFVTISLQYNSELVGADEFGETRLAAAVAKRRDRPVQRLLDEVVTEVDRFIGSRKFDDDVCVSSSADQAEIRFFDQ
jgi:hypothetical protein